MDIFYTPFTIIILYIILYNLIKYYKKKKELGTLTGKYIHYKTINGNKLKVQHLVNNTKLFIECTPEQYKLLQKYKYLK